MIKSKRLAGARPLDLDLSLTLTLLAQNEFSATAKSVANQS
jgi:hypothetical protein